MSLQPQWQRARARVARAPGAQGGGLFLALAPMDGVTDACTRELLTEQFGGRSGVSLCASEFVRVTGQAVQPKVLLRHCPELARDGATRSGVPVFVQLLGGDPVPMAESARRASALGARGIDLNFGCPAKTVNDHDGGAAILREPERIASITAAVREAVPDTCPVSVKIRIGWENADDLETIAVAAQRGGGQWLTVHARTRAQLYKAPVHWHVLDRARQAVSIPVVANGDLFSVESVDACARASGCDAFMIGRGAMGAPDLFARVRGWRDHELSGDEIQAMMRRYVDLMLAAGRTDEGALRRLKMWLRMGGLVRADMAAGFDRVKRCRSLCEGLDALAHNALAAREQSASAVHASV